MGDDGNVWTELCRAPHNVNDSVYALRTKVEISYRAKSGLILAPKLRVLVISILSL